MKVSEKNHCWKILARTSFNFYCRCFFCLGSRPHWYSINSFPYLLRLHFWKCMLNVAIVKGLRSSRQFQQHVPKPVTFNLALPLAVELTFSNQITSQQPIQSRSNPQRLNSNASFSFWPTKSLFNATPWVFVASWCLRIPKVNGSS